MIGTLKQNECGFGAVHEGMGRIAISIQLVKRGLVVVQARARRDSNEGSLESRRGLGDEVESK